MIRRGASHGDAADEQMLQPREPRNTSYSSGPLATDGSRDYGSRLYLEYRTRVASAALELHEVHGGPDIPPGMLPLEHPEDRRGLKVPRRERLLSPSLS